MLRRTGPLILLALALVAGMVPTPALAGPTCRVEHFYLRNDPARGESTLYNCSSASAAAINTILSNTDAAYWTFGDSSRADMRSTDVYMANTKWVIWIDTHSAPDIVRGIWPVDARGSPWPAQQWSEPLMGGSLRSIVQVVSGLGQLNPAHGYGGLHLEVWRDAGNEDLWSYPNRPSCTAECPAPTVRPYVVSWRPERVPLENVRWGWQEYLDTEPPYGVTTLRYGRSYRLTPYVFEITTELSADAETHIRGHIGGLLLLTNRACPFYDCDIHDGYSALDIRRNSFHRVSVYPPVPATEGALPECITALPGGYDLFGTEACGARDRAVSASRSGETMGVDVWHFSATDSPMTWSVQVPWRLSPLTSAYHLIAYHYNTGGLGLTGLGGLDLVSVPLPATRVGPADVLRWTARLTHPG